MKTTIHRYRFDVSKKDERKAYKALAAKLKATPGRGHWHHVVADPKEADRNTASEVVDLETEFLFSNQWNTATQRVFDWYEAIYPNRDIRSGHYLEITQDMIDIRQNTLKCGYCEKLTTEGTFCNKCLDSPHLTEDDLYLIRLLPVIDSFLGNRPDLTADEKRVLLPKYAEAQTTGKSERRKAYMAETREKVTEEARKGIAALETERDGMLWLLDRDFPLDNVIYHSHTDRFCFGWRTPLSESVKSRVLDVLGSEFPYRYEIKCVDGRTLENY